MIVWAQNNQELFQTNIKKATSDIKIDGVLDEAAWANTTSITDFMEKYPRNETRAKTKTEVKITYNEDFIFFAAICFDIKPFVITSLKREITLADNDGFGIVLDPVNTKNNGFLFLVNAYGVQGDGLISINDEDTDGIVIDPTFFGTVGTAENNAGFNLGRTAVHEIGHYLNLYHPWGSASTNFDCKGDDFVSDTPIPVEAISGYPTGLVFGCDNKRVITMNFMNFVQDNWMTMFTEGQKQRMLKAIQDFRPDLVKSAACNSVISDDNVLINNVLIYPNPAKDELNIEVNIQNSNDVTFQIYDISGKIVHHGTFDNSRHNINIDHLEAGFYQIGINIENHNIIKRFLVTN